MEPQKERAEIKLALTIGVIGLTAAALLSLICAHYMARPW